MKQRKVLYKGTKKFSIINWNVENNTMISFSDDNINVPIKSLNWWFPSNEDSDLESIK